jgi:hypothetical protein
MIENHETDNLETTLRELWDARVCPGVQDNIGHDIVNLEVIQRDDHLSRGCRCVGRVDGGNGWSIAGVSGDVRAVGHQIRGWWLRNWSNGGTRSICCDRESWAVRAVPER